MEQPDGPASPGKWPLKCCMLTSLLVHSYSRLGKAPGENYCSTYFTLWMLFLTLCKWHQNTEDLIIAKVKNKGCCCKTVYFFCVLIFAIFEVEVSLHFNFAFFPLFY